MALFYGPGTVDDVLKGWRRVSRGPTPDPPYWHAVAALNTPVRLDGWPGFDEEGNRLGVDAVTARRDAFLPDAVDRLRGGARA